MARKRNEARSVISSEGAGVSATHRRSLRPPVAPTPVETQPEPVAAPAASEPVERAAVATAAAAAAETLALTEAEQDEVARLAYTYWEERGRTHGSPDEDWYRAVQEVKGRRKPKNR
jgi:hypothetical protein